MIRLEPSGLLAAAINNHHRSTACRNCRTNLHVVVSSDEGVTWRNVATLEDTMEPNVRVHYPTLVQVRFGRAVRQSERGSELTVCESAGVRNGCEEADACPRLCSGWGRSVYIMEGWECGLSSISETGS